MAGAVRVNRLYLVVISQDKHAPGDPEWTPIWNGQGGVRVYALDRDRCLLPTDPGEFADLMRAAAPPENWSEVPPTQESSTDGRRSRIATAPAS